MRKLSMIILVILVLFGGFWVARYFRYKPYTARINLLVVPSGSKVDISGHGASSGLRRVRPGTYTVTAQHSGFASQSQSVTVAVGETKFVGLALLSNSPDTQEWYKNHPKDQANFESIISQQFDQTNNQSVAQLPILNKLPFIGPGFGFRIDYGTASDPNAPTPDIIIRYRSTDDKEGALTWLKSQGVDLNKIHIVYKPGNF